jgi:hypothetical protein
MEALGARLPRRSLLAGGRLNPQGGHGQGFASAPISGQPTCRAGGCLCFLSGTPPLSRKPHTLVAHMEGRPGYTAYRLRQMLDFARAQLSQEPSRSIPVSFYRDGMTCGWGETTRCRQRGRRNMAHSVAGASRHDPATMSARPYRPRRHIGRPPPGWGRRLSFVDCSKLIAHEIAEDLADRVKRDNAAMATNQGLDRGRCDRVRARTSTG